MFQEIKELQAILARRLGIAVGSKWDRLSGGRTNMVWLVSGGDQDSDQGKAIVKLSHPNEANPLFPNRPDDEARVMRALAGREICPELLDHVSAPFGEVLVYRYITGNSFTNRISDAAKAMRRLHGTPLSESIRHLPHAKADLRKECLIMLQRLDPQQRADMRALEPKAPLPSPPEQCLLHGDPVAGNLIETHSGCWMIDWQCPAIGDPLRDIGVFLSPSMQFLHRGRVLSSGEQEQFFDSYGDPHTTERYRLSKPIFHWRHAIYCLWRAANGHSEYLTAFDYENRFLSKLAQ